ncbi:MAG: PASTA domain-containing protein [Geminicoccaceae bacterium]
MLSVGIVILIAGLLVPAAGSAAPIIGDPSAAGGPTTDARPPGLNGGGPPRVGVVVSCGVQPDGLTTCAVTRGRASVCPERIPGDDIQRSYRRYDYQLIEGGCTLGADYWRTHSRDGAAPFDDTWDLLGESGRAQFFNAGATYEEILAEGAGDGPYYRLARAFIAAQLNGINSAPLPDDVASAFEAATVLFLAADPERPDAEAAPRLEALADVLEDYNAGAKGPGTCPPLPAEPFSAADVAKTLQGAESRDAGRIVAVDQRYDRGAGVIAIQPLSQTDEFLLSDEAFIVDGVRKAEFTTQLTDCVDVATGQETTIAVGGVPTPPRLTTAAFLGQERVVRLMVAVSEAAAEAAEVAPAAGPAAAGVSTGPAFPGAGTTIGGPGSFPSQVFPAATAGGGGGAAFMTVPDLIGSTVAEARSMINAAGLSIGTVTVEERRAMLDAIIDVAWAQGRDSAIVVDQTPDPGTEAGPGEPVDITAEFSVPIPEPASLLLFATGLAVILVVMARRRSA